MDSFIVIVIVIDENGKRHNEGIIRTPDAKKRADIQADKLRAEGKKVVVEPYCGQPRKPY